MTEQDNPRVPTSAEIYNMARSMLCGCLTDCQNPAAAAVRIADMEVLHSGRWPFRWAFDFNSTDADYYAFATGLDRTVEWDGTDWKGALLSGPCPGGAGGETPTYQWQVVRLDDSLDPRQWNLKLLRNGGTGTCDEWQELVYENPEKFDPLCPNLFVPKQRGIVAPYSDGLSCRICLKPALNVVSIECLGETMLVPERLGIRPQFGFFSPTECADASSLLGDIIPFTYDSGCAWVWGDGPHLLDLDAPCDDVTYEWIGSIEIVDAGGGEKKLVITIREEWVSANAGCAVFDDAPVYAEYVYESAATDDIEAALISGLPCTLSSSDVGETDPINETVCMEQIHDSEIIIVYPL